MSHSVYSWFQMLLGFLGVIGLFLILFALLAALFLRKKKQDSADVKIEVKSINHVFDEQKNQVLSAVLDTEQWKKNLKEQKEKSKQKKKQSKNQDPEKKKIFVLDFVGDIAAGEVKSFRHQVSALLQVAKPTDEIVVRLESVGGMVHAYGLAASQLARIREKNIPLTVCVDKVAASGGYMMACLANKLIAAPFSIIGSIGVVANVPNLNRLLHKHDVDYFEMTAGEYKRTLSTFGEVTDKGKAKFQEQLEETHGLFKDHIKKYRTHLEMETVATGEYWLGTKALEHKLVDELGTSDDYLLGLSSDFQIYQITSPKKETLKDKLSHVFGSVVFRLISKHVEDSKIPMAL